MGIVVFTFLAPRAAVEFVARRTSTLSPINSAVSSGSRSNLPSADLYSITMFFPSTYPRSRRPCQNASRKSGFVEPDDRYPIRGTFFGCCASDGKQSARSKEHGAKSQTKMFFLIAFLTPFASRLTPDFI